MVQKYGEFLIYPYGNVARNVILATRVHLFPKLRITGSVRLSPRLMCPHEMVQKYGVSSYTHMYVSTCCHEMVLKYGEFLIYPYVCLHTGVKDERKNGGK
jgi:hypothetical protein